MQTLDRYLIRQVLPAFGLALAILTFVLAVNPALDRAEDLLSKNVPLGTVGFLLLTLLPQALGLTIPMAFLIGCLMALGRMSGDREAIALLACGVSPLRLLRPVLALAIVLGLADLYVMTRLIPDANQMFRETTYQLLAQQGSADIKPGVFYEGFPGKVIFVRTTEPDGTWGSVMVADTTTPDRPALTLAEGGRLELLPDRRLVNLWLRNASRYLPGADAQAYDRTEDEQLRLPIDPAAVFGDGTFALTKGPAELDIAGLRGLAAERVKANESPHNEIMRIHQMFSFPVACLVFAVLALPLGLHTRKEGKLAGFTLGLATIFVYYALLAQAEGAVKGGSFPAEWARWVPNLALGAAGLVAVWWRARARGQSLSLRLPAWALALAGRRRTGRPTADGQGGVAPQPARPVVVIRLPAVNLPRPRLLDVYVVKSYMRILVLSVVGLLGLTYISQFIELADKLFKGNASGTVLMTFLAYSTPQFVAYLLPVATLVAVLSTIGGLTRTSELIVMRACGVSLYRAALPLVLFALVLSGVLFVLEERVLAVANRRADELNDQIRDRPSRTLNVANRNWLAGEDGRIYYFAFFDRARRSLFALSVYDTDREPYRLAAHTFVRDAVHRDGAWQAGTAWIQKFTGGAPATRSDLSHRRLDLAPIEDFERAQVDASVMTFGEQREHVAQLEASGYSATRQKVELYQKVAFPLVTVVMTLLAIPFGVTTGRHGALYGIGLVIGLAFGYHFLTTIFMAAGGAELLPAAMAAWAANVLFLAAAGYLLLTVRT
jgi:LPS export ABC transporter permease LptG/LPS export ABC transporter permease LptF